MSRQNFDVVAPVKVRVAPIDVHFFHRGPADFFRDDGTTITLPEAVLGRCQVQFVFNGRFVRSKTIRGAYRWTDRLGWPRDDDASSAEVADARRVVARGIADRILDHIGIEEGSFEVRAFDGGAIVETFTVERTAAERLVRDSS